MTDAETRRILTALADYMDGNTHHVAHRLPAPLYDQSLHDVVWTDDLLSHIRWMIDEAATFDEVQHDKAQRWIGFVQGALVACGWATVNDMKAMNAPVTPGSDNASR